jgi:pyruvate kinase
MPTTKIVATLGPASNSPAIIRSLFEAGVDVFRLNASHGTQEEHAARIRSVRQIGAELGLHTGILLDLQGPKIRLGTFEGGSCVLETGQRFTITTEPVLGNRERASTTYAGFARDVRAGDLVLLADGTVQLRVLSTNGVAAICEVIDGGLIGDRKGINLPGVRVSSPSLTKKDLADARFGLDAGVDFLALSFVRSRDDVLRLKLYVQEAGAATPVIAKIEKPEGWTHLDAILEQADGVMVARGDLGVEMALEKVPFIQKSIIRRARARGKFVITATQMLESLTDNPLPTRAEVSDVANAIYDGTDAVMLSAETSAGKFPIDAARMMVRIASEAEGPLRRQGYKDPPARPEPTHADIIADAAYHAARSAGVAAIVVFTATGSTARLIARYRPPVPIYAFAPEDATARRLSIVYGVRSIVAPPVPSTDQMLTQLEHMLLERRYLKSGDSVVFVAGQPIGKPGTTNLIKLHRIGARG